MTKLKRLPWSAALLLLVVTWSSQVVAHARLVKSTPTASARLSRSPAAISLWFNEAPEAEFSTIKIRDSAGHLIAQGKLRATAEPNGLTLLIVQTLPDGDYVVHYRVLSVDGHIIKDKFRFRLGAKSGP